MLTGASLRDTKDCFLINYFPVQIPVLVLNSMLNEKNHVLKMMQLHPNVATNASAVSKVHFLLIFT